MRLTEQTKQVLIEARTADAYNKAYEEMAQQLEGVAYEVENAMSGELIRTMFRWTIRERIAETAEDRAELKGIKYYCGECPFFHHNPDKRVKYSICDKGRRATCNGYACDELYEEVERGEVEI